MAAKPNLHPSEVPLSLENMTSRTRITYFCDIGLVRYDFTPWEAIHAPFAGQVEILGMSYFPPELEALLCGHTPERYTILLSDEDIEKLSEGNQIGLHEIFQTGRRPSDLSIIELSLLQEWIR